MGRVNDDQWLDEALNQALHSDDTRPDFQKWSANHPEAVEKLTARTPPVAASAPDKENPHERHSSQIRGRRRDRDCRYRRNHPIQP